jgi:hypothetical protein
MPPYEKNKKPYKKIYGFVCPHDTGTFQGKRPVVIDAYTDTVVKNLSTARPVISASGLPRTAAILLYNQSHWTIQNIEVRNIPKNYDSLGCVNKNFAVPLPGSQQRSKWLNWRWGILVYYDTATIYYNRDITIRQCAVDSVLGGDDSLVNISDGPIDSADCPWWAQEYARFNYDIGDTGQPSGVDLVVSICATGGITIKTDGHTCSKNYVPALYKYSIIADRSTAVDSILIDSCKIHDIFGEGITLNNDSVGVNSSNYGTANLLDSNLRFIGDTIYRTAGNGIHLFGGFDSAIISGNIIDSVGCGLNNKNIADGSRLTKSLVGIELDVQRSSVIQYNAISNTAWWDTILAPGDTAKPTDAEAIDFDGNLGLLPFGRIYVQYNYSCNNPDGFFNSAMQSLDTTFVKPNDTLAVVRYNISQNDGMGVYLSKNLGAPQPLVMNDGKGGNLLYNNVFYNDTGMYFGCANNWQNMPTFPRDFFINNIFLTRSQNSNTQGAFCQWEWLTNFPSDTPFSSHNCYYDLAQSSDTAQSNFVALDPAPILANPNIANPGKAANGALNNEISSAKLCYPLKEPSSCFETGIRVNDTNGINGTITDFWGTNVSTFPWPDVGAYQDTPTVKTQKIPLAKGWNLISFNLFPYNNSVAAVFKRDSSGKGGLDTNFEVYDTTMPGVGYMYWPHKNINTFPNSQLPDSLISKAFKIYTDVPDTLNVQGTSVDYAHTNVPMLTPGDFWNQIAYLPQTDDSITHALASLPWQGEFPLVVENNSLNIYEPSQGINSIGVMHVGQGYYVQVPYPIDTFFYPTPDTGVAKRVASKFKPMLNLPKPHHYAIHASTGNFDPILVKQVTIGGKLVPDLSEIGAFDASGSLVGSGTILKGVAAFVVCGQNPMVKQKDGLASGEPVTFKLWDGSSEYPLEFQSSNGSSVAYKAGAVFQGQMTVSGGYLITKFDLTQAYPNPFRGSVKISFDVPSIAGESQQAIEINVYDLKGSLVKQLASGKYQAGHYTVAWNCSEGREASMGSSVYIVRMKATNFDKRLKLLRVQ